MQLNLFDLNLLRALEAILIERNVTRAAERIHLSQPAMSGALRRLRDQFQDQLLVRVGQTNELTPLGLTLLQPVQELVQQISRTLNLQPDFDPQTSTRSFCIAATDYVSVALLHPLIKHLAEVAPRINLQIVNMSDDTANGLIMGQIDMCITVERWIEMRAAGEIPNLYRKMIFEDEYCCIVDVNHPEIGDAVSLETYERLPHITVKLGEFLGAVVASGWSAAEIAPRIAVTVPNFNALARLVEDTGMIGTIPRLLAMNYSAAGRTKVIDSPVRFEPIKECIVWHARSNQEPGHMFLRDQLSRLAAEIKI